jgi:hypothetical protein
MTPNLSIRIHPVNLDGPEKKRKMTRNVNDQKPTEGVSYAEE